MKEWWDLNISRLGGIRINGVSTGQDFCAFTPQIGDFSTDFLVTDGFSGEGFDEVIWIWSSSGYNFITARSVNNFFQKTYYLLKQQIWYVSLSLLDFIGVNQWRFSPDLGYVSESLRFAALNMNCFFSTRFGMWYMEIISKILSRIIDNPLIVSIYGDGICQDLLIGDSLVNRNLWIFLGVKSWRYGCLEFIGNMGESFSTSQHISLLRFTGSVISCIVFCSLFWCFKMTQGQWMAKSGGKKEVAKAVLKITVPRFDNSELIASYGKTLIGRCMNPSKQDMKILLFMLPRIWQVEGRVF